MDSRFGGSWGRMGKGTHREAIRLPLRSIEELVFSLTYSLKSQMGKDLAESAAKFE